MRTLLKITSSLAALALTFSTGNAQAALVNFTLTGAVTYADAGNLFGLDDTDSVSVVGSFDDSALLGGSGSVSFTSGGSFTVTAGDFTFDQTDDDLATLVLDAGAFDEFNFLANIGALGSFDSMGGFFDGDDDNSGTMGGTWTAFSMTPAVVPVPAAAWLFGSGLLGLVGFARRKAA